MKKILLILTLVIFNSGIYAQVDRSKPPKSGPPPVINLGKPNTFKLNNGLILIYKTLSKFS